MQGCIGESLGKVEKQAGTDRAVPLHSCTPPQKTAARRTKLTNKTSEKPLGVGKIYTDTCPNTYTLTTKLAPIHETTEVNLKIPSKKVSFYSKPTYPVRNYGWTDQARHAPSFWIVDTVPGHNLVSEAFLQLPWRMEIQQLESPNFQSAAKQSISIVGGILLIIQMQAYKSVPALANSKTSEMDVQLRTTPIDWDIHGTVPWGGKLRPCPYVQQQYYRRGPFRSNKKVALESMPDHTEDRSAVVNVRRVITEWVKVESPVTVTTLESHLWIIQKHTNHRKRNKLLSAWGKEDLERHHVC